MSFCILCSVVTVSKISPSVGFGRFCKKKRGFRFGFGFCLSRFPSVVNVVRLCGPLHIKPAAVRYIFLCITPVDSSKYPTACDWWCENHHLYPTSHVLRHATCLAVCATDIRRHTCSQTDVIGWLQKSWYAVLYQAQLASDQFEILSTQYMKSIIGMLCLINEHWQWR